MKNILSKTTNKIKAIALFCLLGSQVFGTEFPKAFTTRENLNFQDSNSLYFNFNNSNFLWNNEFFNDVMVGYTLIGYHATPSLQYHFSKNFSIEAGVHLLKYSGLKDYTTIAPVYTASYHKKDFALLMGTISGTVNHRLSEPMYFFENYFTDNLENGVQAIWNKHRFNLDVWLDWRSFIFVDDDKQEALTAGIASEIFAVKNDSWELMIPITLLVTHRGGQIDTSSAHLRTPMNYSFGLRADKNLKFKLVTNAELEFIATGFYDNSPVKESIYSAGYGFLSNLKLKHNFSFLRFGYWYGYKYLSTMGHPMYQCYSVKGEGFHKTERKLINAELYYSKNIYKGIYLGLSGETFFDLNTNDLDYAMGITLLVNSNFLVKRFKTKTQ